ncbi:peptide-methionine (S)-S-oxide reductase [Nonlabens ponticola]|uniref:peptide-methionine (S)-S-oxide reductase n=1 Tax=Nonlabens ponticola TaxID=2496866 RepID=A0A3S9MXF8_9FLAO|nr:peptide-methionine (S)-S-oxide reductase [Nonlabens ponticola]AZQ43956.1 peptide methionine sulfoxide reductase [Nonlabens ponticola]
MIKTIGLGGGCHWCTEAVFKRVYGVNHVRQGYIKSVSPDHTFSEAILLKFDARVVSLERLLEIHLATHSSTSMHQRRTDYRSAAYYLDDATGLLLSDLIVTLSRKHHKKYILQVLPMVAFKESRESIRDYYATRPDAPFCKRYIEPKLEIVKAMQDQ